MVKGRKYVVGTVTRGGQRWRFVRKNKGEVETLVEDKLTELEQEGVESVSLSGEAKRDAAKARKLLDDGETLESALHELALVRDVMGRGKGLVDALTDYSDAQKRLAGRATLTDVAAFWAERNPDGSAVKLGEAREAFMRELRGEVVRSSATRVEARLIAFLEWLGGGNLQAGDERSVVSVEARDIEEFWMNTNGA